MVLSLARILGAQGYGQFVTAVAISSFFTPLAGLGLAGAVLRDGARRPHTLPALLIATLRRWALSTAAFAVLAALALWLFLPPSAGWAALGVLAVAEVVSGSLSELIARAQQALHLTGRFGAILTGLPLIRLFALGGLLLLFAPLQVEHWMWAYALSSLAYAALLVQWTRRTLLHDGVRMQAPSLRDSLPFAIGALSYRLQAEFNKPVLAQLGFAEAGYFNVAQRVLDLASLPLSALQEALWPRLYASVAPQRRALQTGAVLVALALIGGGILALAAPLLPWLFGVNYSEAAHTLVWLAWLPAVQVARNVGNALLISRGRTSALNGIYIAAALASIVLALILVPRYELAGAVVAAYGGEAVALLVQGLSIKSKQVKVSIRSP